MSLRRLPLEDGVAHGDTHRLGATHLGIGFQFGEGAGGSLGTSENTGQCDTSSAEPSVKEGTREADSGWAVSPALPAVFGMPTAPPNRHRA